MEARVQVHETVLAFLHGQRIVNQSSGGWRGRQASKGNYKCIKQKSVYNPNIRYKVYMQRYRLRGKDQIN